MDHAGGAAKQTALWLNTAAVGVAAWVMFFPHLIAVGLTLTALAPALALAWIVVSRGGWTLAGGPKDARPSLDPLIILASLALCLRSVFDLHILDWPAAWAMAAIVGLAFGLATLLTMRGAANQRVRLAVMLGVGLAYGWGLVTEVDARMDLSPATPVPVAVVRKWATAGRPETYNLALTPWGQTASSVDMMIPAAFYRQVSAGDVVCVTPRRGALEIRWFVLGFCGTPTTARTSF